MSALVPLAFALLALGLPQSDAARAKRVELLESWKEALELGLPAEVLDEAAPLVTEGGALATDGESLALYARALCDTGGTERARQVLESSRSSERTRPAVEIALARIELDADQLRAVEKRLAAPGDARDAVRYPDRAECWLVLARARVRAGDAKGAAPLLERFVERWPLDPEGPSAWHMLAQEALARRDLERARTCRERAEELAAWHGYYRARRLQVREHPRDPLPRLGLAQLMLAVGNLERARAELLELVAIAPDFCRGLATLGEVERKRGDAAAARAAYDRALACDPALGEVRFNRGLLALVEGRRADARADFEALVAGKAADDPRLVAAHLYLARLLRDAGETESAAARYAAYRERGGTEPLEEHPAGG